MGSVTAVAVRLRRPLLISLALGASRGFQSHRTTSVTYELSRAFHASTGFELACVSVLATDVARGAKVVAPPLSWFAEAPSADYVSMVEASTAPIAGCRSLCGYSAVVDHRPLHSFRDSTLPFRPALRLRSYICLCWVVECCRGFQWRGYHCRGLQRGPLRAILLRCHRYRAEYLLVRT